MTLKQKKELIAAVSALLERMIPIEEAAPAPIIVSKVNKPEMFAIKECAALVSGLTEHTVRMRAQARTKGVQGERPAAKTFVAPPRSDKSIFALIAARIFTE